MQITAGAGPETKINVQHGCLGHVSTERDEAAKFSHEKDPLHDGGH